MASADNLKETLWESYGISFVMPGNSNVEENSEDGFIASSSEYYLEIQMLESNGISVKEMSKDLLNIAKEDGLEILDKVSKFELPQFHGVKMAGKYEEERITYSYLMAKDKSCALFISISYTEEKDSTPNKILQSFGIAL